MLFAIGVLESLTNLNDAITLLFERILIEFSLLYFEWLEHCLLLAKGNLRGHLLRLLESLFVLGSLMFRNNELLNLVLELVLNLDVGSRQLPLKLALLSSSLSGSLFVVQNYMGAV